MALPTKAKDNARSLDPTKLRTTTGYMPIEHHGLIGNMHTAALVATDGGLDFMCWPNFDSPSVFCRMLDREKGGCFTIAPANEQLLTTKQQYLPSSNILQTTFMSEEGALRLTDLFPRPKQMTPLEALEGEHRIENVVASDGQAGPLKKWLVRRIECIRGQVDVDVNCLPAFNYARDHHSVSIFHKHGEHDGEPEHRAVFRSKQLSLELLVTVDGTEGDDTPEVLFTEAEGSGLGSACVARVHLQEGQQVSFVLREEADTTHVTTALLDRLQQQTRVRTLTLINFT